MNITKLAQTIAFGRAEAKRVANGKVEKSWKSVYRDMVLLSARYGISSGQYVNHRIYELSGEERKQKCKELSQIKQKKKDWDKLYRSNWRFLAKWTNEKYSGRPYLSYMRGKAYQKHYHLDNYPMVQYGVQIICEHQQVGKLNIGKNVLLAREVDLDYTGDLTIEDGVALSEGVKILTHNHEIFPKDSDEYTEDCISTPLVVRDHAWMGARACILPGVGEIGRSALIGVGAVVKNKVPPYAIVLGNPAKIVGFVYAPEEVIKYEESRYSDDQKTDIIKYERYYNKFFINRSSFIKEFINN